MEEEEEDDLEISFKPSSITTFLPFPPVDSSAHLLNARSAKVGTYSQRREIGTISDLDISSLGRYVFGSVLSYNKAPPRLPGLAC